MNYVNTRYKLLSRRYSYIKQEFNYYWLQSDITHRYKKDAKNAQKEQRIIERSMQDPKKWISIVSNNNQRWEKPETYKDQ
jgi:hypothetical protein